MWDLFLFGLNTRVDGFGPKSASADVDVSGGGEDFGPPCLVGLPATWRPGKHENVKDHMRDLERNEV